MDSISASERRNSLLKTVWKRLNKSVSCWPQASAASVSSCCTAETWMAEISASVAQADPLASARLALTKQSSVADAPARKILFIATVPNFDGSPARDPDCVSSQKDPSAAKKLACNKLRDFEFPACNLAEFRHASGKGCNRRVHRAFGDGNFGPGHAGSLPGYAFAPISRRPQTGSRREQKPLSDDLYRRSRPQPGCQRRPCGCFLDAAGIELHAVLQRRRGPGRRHVPAEVASRRIVRPGLPADSGSKPGLFQAQPLFSMCPPGSREGWTMAYKVAVVGATGNGGREMLSVLAERQFPVSEVVALASTRSVGTEVSFGDRILKVKALDYFDFKGTDICLMSAGGKVAKEWAPKIVAQGAIVIDNSSAWRMDRGVPLVVPEVNADALNEIKKGIIANPNCSTAQLVVALKPLHDLAIIKRAVISTYQSVSGAGKDAMDELFRQTRAVFVADPIEREKFTKQIAFNVIPHIDVFLDSGYTKEEWKMMVETQKILDPDIQVTATCVRVPVFIGHSEAVTLEFEKPITADKARAILREAPGVLLVDKREDGGYVTPIEAAGEDATYVSRIRKDPTVEHGLSMWVVSDNLRKGAALNAVQIAECVINRKLLKKAA